MKLVMPVVIAFFFSVLGIGCGSEKEVAIDVFAGSASKPALEEVIQAFKRDTGIEVYASYGGSGTMLSQIELARAGDVYIPGSPDYMMMAERKKVVDSASVLKVAYLVPVIAMPRGNPLEIKTLADLARPGLRVGIGNPEAVCVGLYAIEILEYNHLLEQVGRNIVVHAKSCEDTATLISLQSVDAVIGWDVFHHWDPENIDVIFLEPEQLPRLAYIPAAMTAFSRDEEKARRFLEFLVSPKAQAIFQKWGYITTEAEARKFAPRAEIGGEYSLPAGYRPAIK